MLVCILKHINLIRSLVKENTKLTVFTIGILLGTFLLNVETTAVNMALLAMSKSLNMSLASTDLIITVMLLSSAAIVVAGGRMGDIYGYFRIIIIGLIMFLIGATLCALAQEVFAILIGRCLQGIGAGLCCSNLVTYAYISFPEEKKGLISGLVMGMVGLAIACGPIFGGLFTQFMNWRWIFWIDIPIGAISIFLILGFKQKQPINNIKGGFDIFGLIFSAVIMVGIMLSLQHIKGIEKIRYIFPVITIAAVIIFYFGEKRKKNPLIDFGLIMSNSKIILGCAGRFISVIVFWVILFVLSIYVEKSLGCSPVIGGLVLMPMTALIGLMSPIGGIIVDKIGTRLPNIVGMISFIISSILLYIFSVSLSMVVFFIMLALFGSAFSIVSTSMLHFTLQESPNDSKGVINGIYYMISLLGGIVGLPLVEPYISESGIDLSSVSIICLVSSIIGTLIFLIYYIKNPSVK